MPPTRPWSNDRCDCPRICTLDPGLVVRCLPPTVEALLPSPTHMQPRGETDQRV